MATISVAAAPRGDVVWTKRLQQVTDNTFDDIRKQLTESNLTPNEPEVIIDVFFKFGSNDVRYLRVGTWVEERKQLFVDWCKKFFNELQRSGWNQDTENKIVWDQEDYLLMLLACVQGRGGDPQCDQNQGMENFCLATRSPRAHHSPIWWSRALDHAHSMLTKKRRNSMCNREQLAECTAKVWTEFWNLNNLHWVPHPNISWECPQDPQKRAAWCKAIDDALSIQAPNGALIAPQQEFLQLIFRIMSHHDPDSPAFDKATELFTAYCDKMHVLNSAAPPDFESDQFITHMQGIHGLLEMIRDKILPTLVETAATNREAEFVAYRCIANFVSFAGPLGRHFPTFARSYVKICFMTLFKGFAKEKTRHLDVHFVLWCLQNAAEFLDEQLISFIDDQLCSVSFASRYDDCWGFGQHTEPKNVNASLHLIAAVFRVLLHVLDGNNTLSLSMRNECTFLIRYLLDVLKMPIDEAHKDLVLKCQNANGKLHDIMFNSVEWHRSAPRSDQKTWGNPFTDNPLPFPEAPSAKTHGQRTQGSSAKSGEENRAQSCVRNAKPSKRHRKKGKRAQKSPAPCAKHGMTKRVELPHSIKDFLCDVCKKAFKRLSENIYVYHCENCNYSVCRRCFENGPTSGMDTSAYAEGQQPVYLPETAKDDAD